jgi:hypothetical protein
LLLLLLLAQVRPPSVEALVSLAAHSFSGCDLLRVERLLLDALEFKLAAPTPYGCLHLLTQVRARLCLCFGCGRWCVRFVLSYVCGGAAGGAHALRLPAPAHTGARDCVRCVLCLVCAGRAFVCVVPYGCLHLLTQVCKKLRMLAALRFWEVCVLCCV